MMRLVASVSLAFLIASVPISPQSSSYGALVAGMENLNGKSQTATPAVADPANPAAVSQGRSRSCPIALRAQHGADGTMRQVGKSRPEGVAQLLHLILNSKDSRQIVEARLRVRGVSPQGRVSHADASPVGADTVRNISVQLKLSSESEVTGNAWVPGMSAVLGVELNSVSFSDGSTQRFSAADGCKFTPEHFMLIAEEAK